MRAHLWQSLANYTQQGFGLLLGLILARLLQPEDFGAFGFAAASVLLALLPATWSLAPTLIMDAAAAPAFYATAAAFGWCVVFVRLAIVAGLVTWFYLSGQHQTALLCLLCGIIESWKEPNTVQRAYLEGQGNFKPNLISALLGVVFCLGVVVPVALFLRGGPFTLVHPGLGVACKDFFLYRLFREILHTDRIATRYGTRTCPPVAKHRATSPATYFMVAHLPHQQQLSGSGPKDEAPLIKVARRVPRASHGQESYLANPCHLCAAGIRAASKHFYGENPDASRLRGLRLRGSNGAPVLSAGQLVFDASDSY